MVFRVKIDSQTRKAFVLSKKDNSSPNENLGHCLEAFSNLLFRDNLFGIALMQKLKD